MPLNTELWQQPASTFDVQYAARFDQSANSYMEQTFANDDSDIVEENIEQEDFKDFKNFKVK